MHNNTFFCIIIPIQFIPISKPNSIKTRKINFLQFSRIEINRILLPQRFCYTILFQQQHKENDQHSDMLIIFPIFFTRKMLDERHFSKTHFGRLIAAETALILATHIHTHPSRALNACYSNSFTPEASHFARDWRIRGGYNEG